VDGFGSVLPLSLAKKTIPPGWCCMGAVTAHPYSPFH
jgi:hypothetical protein